MALSPVALRASTSAASADRSAFTRSNSPALMAANRSVSLDSFMRRFYLLLEAALLMVSSPVWAQTPADTPTLGSTFTAPALADLPTGGSLYSVLDTMP